MNQSGRLWLPDHGPSGLIVVARARPLALVVGGRIVEAVSEPLQDPARTPAALHESRSAGGLVILSRSSRREPTRIVGHPDLATHARFRRGDTLYISVAEAVHRERLGEDVEIHFEPDEDDREALASVALKARRQWEGDQLPDGWMRPRHAPPTTKFPANEREESLQGLADAIRERRNASRGSDVREPPTR